MWAWPLAMVLDVIKVAWRRQNVCMVSGEVSLGFWVLPQRTWDRSTYDMAWLLETRTIVRRVLAISRPRKQYTYRPIQTRDRPTMHIAS